MSSCCSRRTAIPRCRCRAAHARRSRSPDAPSFRVEDREFGALPSAADYAFLFGRAAAFSFFCVRSQMSLTTSARRPRLLPICVSVPMSDARQFTEALPGGRFRVQRRGDHDISRTAGLTLTIELVDEVVPELLPRSGTWLPESITIPPLTLANLTPGASLCRILGFIPTGLR